MPSLTISDLEKYIAENIGAFHAQRLKSLEKLKLKQVLLRKNPYLFKAKNIISGPDLVRAFMDAHLSSQEEGLLGTFLEGLARFVSEKMDGGHKSSAKGIDLEFTRKGVTYIVTVKSGPNWGNSGQIEKMESDFKTAKRILGTNRTGHSVVAVNGCCYGRETNPDKGAYLKLCGQEFWKFLTGDDAFYIKIVKPIGYKAKERNAAFDEEYAKVITRLTSEFISEFCDEGIIDWTRLLKFNSGHISPKQ